MVELLEDHLTTIAVITACVVASVLGRLQRWRRGGDAQEHQDDPQLVIRTLIETLATSAVQRLTTGADDFRAAGFTVSRIRKDRAPG